ncbi:MAG TPA: sugar ABC transporter permease, partial [Ilumatobacteraceae bacterium]
MPATGGDRLGDPPPTTHRDVGARRVHRSRSTPQLGRLPGPTIVAFLAPALILYTLFVLYPIVQSMRYSLYDWNGLESLDDFVGFDNFRRALSDPIFLDAIRHNAIIVVLSVGVQIPFALGLAVLLNSKIAGRRMMRTLFFAPYVLSEVVTGVVWRQILRPDGLVDQSLQAVGAGGMVQEWLANPDIVLYSLFFVITWKYFGFHMVLMLAGLQQIPKELEEAAAIDGATRWQTFRHVTLPLLGPTIRVSIFLSVIGALQLFDLVWVTTKGGPIGASSTMATYLYDQFRRGLFGYASAVSIVIFVLSLVVALLYQRHALRRDLRGTGLVG